MVKEQVRLKIKELVERYRNLENTKSEKEMSEISEANVRADFIDPLFEGLGWKVKDPDEYDREHYVRKVGHADIALKLKKEPVVFIEAKRFGAVEDISKRGEADWMDAERQVMNYALGKGIKWAILTNFEKFRLFNAFNGFTVLDIKAYWELEERLDDLLYLTKDSFEIGHIDKLERREERPDIDYKFLESLNRWRLKLANDIYYNNYANEEQYKKELNEVIKSAEKLTNQRLKKFKIEVATKKLSEVDYSLLKNEKGNLRINLLKSAVQRILDRLVIIRYAEDKLILDNPDQLRALYESWQSTKKYTSLFGLLKGFFAGFNEIHDSRIFETDHICEKVKVSDELIGEIINEMYEVNFRKFDFDILGNTYESYLGHTLNTTEDGKVELVPSQETRKESGIYYTPPYVVDYIVKNTVGEVLKDKKPEEVKNIRVLDPACGSGSFLIKAYDYFEDYYRTENARKREKKRKKIKELLKNNKNQITFKDEDMVNFEEHTGYEAEILQSNIFGVDLDEQAAEIASVNLVLKALRRKEMLPLILGHTVMVGNSLISGTEEELGQYFGDDWQNVRPFNWEEEFAQVMEEGGFDVVIGNPPYGAKLTENDRKYISDAYEFSASYKNTALIFMELSTRLLNENGLFGMILPKSLAFSQKWEPGRDLIRPHLLRIVDVSKAFKDVLLEQVIVILRKGEKIGTYTINSIEAERDKSMNIDKGYLDKTRSIILHADPNDFQIFQKMLSNCIYLGEISKTSRGLPYQKYVTKDQSGNPILRGINISRYAHLSSNEYLSEELIDEDDDKITFLRQPKIVSQRIVAHVTTPRAHIIIMSSIDMDGILTVDTVENTIITDSNYCLEFVLCLLNSKLISWYSYRYIFANAIRTMDLDDYYIGKIPVPRVEIDQEFFISLANHMVALNKQLQETDTDFSHYINLHPRIKDMKLEDYLKQIPEKDKEVLKDGSGKPANQLEGKVKKFEVREEEDWLVFKVGYSVKTQKGTEIIIEFDAFKCRILDTNLRKFIYYGIKEFITPGKVGKGNLYDRILRIKLPCFNSKEEENKKVIDSIMEPYLREVTKKEKIEKEIADTDKTIDRKVYELYGLTEEEIKIVEGSLER